MAYESLTMPKHRFLSSWLVVYGLQSWLAVLLWTGSPCLCVCVARDSSQPGRQRGSLLLSPSFHPAAVSAVQLNCSCLFGRLITLRPFPPHTSIVPCRGYSSSNSIFIFYAFLFSPSLSASGTFATLSSINLLVIHACFRCCKLAIFSPVRHRFSTRSEELDRSSRGQVGARTDK